MTYMNPSPIYQPLRMWGPTPNKVSLFPKSGFRGGMSRTRSGMKKIKKKGRQVSTFAQKVLAVNPAKHLKVSTNPTMGNAELFYANATAGITQGTNVASRLGDGVNLEALKLSGCFLSAVASNAYAYRIIVGWSGEEYGSNVLATGGITPSEVFFTGGNSQVNSIINPKAFTVIYDEKFDINSQVTGSQTIHTFDQTVPLKRKFVYQEANSIYGKNKNLYILVVGFGAGLAVSDPIGQILLDYDLIFK